MILSVSRRTDIPAFYSEWFLNRIKAGFIDVRNPMNIHQISRINIKPEVVDCIVFWTKNAIPLTSHLDELDAFKYYFQYTINSYDTSIEEFVPKKIKVIENFCNISNKIGSNRTIWRYDPIFITNKINVAYHIHYFEELAKRLSGYTNTCVISFVDVYKKNQHSMADAHIGKLSEYGEKQIAKEFSEIASKYGIKLQSCSEKIDLSEVGIEHGACIDKTLIESIVGYKLDVKKDKTQRTECQCVQSIDIGQYNTCPHICKYCYANYNKEWVFSQNELHDKNSSLLIGNLQDNDVIKERKVKLLRNNTFL